MTRRTQTLGLNRNTTQNIKSAQTLITAGKETNFKQQLVSGLTLERESRDVSGLCVSIIKASIL